MFKIIVGLFSIVIVLQFSATETVEESRVTVPTYFVPSGASLLGSSCSLLLAFEIWFRTENVRIFEP